MVSSPFRSFLSPANELSCEADLGNRGRKMRDGWSARSLAEGTYELVLFYVNPSCPCVRRKQTYSYLNAKVFKKLI